MAAMDRRGDSSVTSPPVSRFCLSIVFKNLNRIGAIVGIKNVTINEPFFQGHFPGRPVMPGVLIIEAMAQVGGVLVFKSIGSCRQNPWCI